MIKLGNQEDLNYAKYEFDSEYGEGMVGALLLRLWGLSCFIRAIFLEASGIIISPTYLSLTLAIKVIIIIWILAILINIAFKNIVELTLSHTVNIMLILLINIIFVSLVPAFVTLHGGFFIELVFAIILVAISDLCYHYINKTIKGVIKR
ncbi:MAG: hypothetical protein PHI66_00615 [Candidatus Pacebacteria bacterium]|nr:hypothetical protein [Candidatus Paceibacterota bacterium]